MLTEIKEYLATHKRVFIREVAMHFDIPPEVARAALDHWVRKGKVSRLDIAGQCQAGCGGPCSERRDVYQWIDRPPPGG
ncbi:FeoC-like transcriptional regulator [Methylocapsa aurea]|uniref:FeoC-like transcriptional regulator n=1 Tax=Methylocapsa aurea TaxID=663610 RepID=UPI00056A077F|nr:FeoC-like transcriptional regulator [Methylocapsa aurea]